MATALSIDFTSPTRNAWARTFAGLLMLSGLLLSGCASQQTAQTPHTHPAPSNASNPSDNKDADQAKSIRTAPKLSDWEEYQAVMISIEHWEAQGKLGIRIPGDSGSVYFNWYQKPDNFAIHLSGPLGSGASWIRGNGQRVSLEQGNSKPVYAENLEKLMYSTLGWSMPVSELFYWIRGIPSPESDIDLEHRDELGRLAQLHQQGWQINFDRYRDFEGWSLPGKLSATRGDMKLTFIIKNWTLH